MRSIDDEVSENEPAARLELKSSSAPREQKELDDSPASPAAVPTVLTVQQALKLFDLDAPRVSPPSVERRRRRSAPSRPTRPLRPEGLSPNVMTVAEVGARFACSRTRVFMLLREGDLDRAALPSKCTLVTLASVERYERMQHAAPRRRTGGGAVDLVARRAALEDRRAKLLRGRNPGR